MSSPKLSHALRARILRASLLGAQTAKEIAFAENIAKHTVEYVLRKSGYTRHLISRGEREIILGRRAGDPVLQKILNTA